MSALGVYLVWGVYLVPGGVPDPRGCTWSGGSALGGVPGLGGVPDPKWGCLLQGVSALGGVPGPGECTWSGTPPVDRQMPVNILPCPKLHLQAVNMYRCKTRDSIAPFLWHLGIQNLQICPNVLRILCYSFGE